MILYGMRQSGWVGEGCVSKSIGLNCENPAKFKWQFKEVVLVHMPMPNSPPCKLAVVVAGCAVVHHLSYIILYTHQWAKSYLYLSNILTSNIY